MKEPRKLSIDTKGYHGNRLSLSHLDDTGKCHFMTSNYGELTYASLTKSQVKKVISWLERWVAFKDANYTKGEKDE